MNHDNKNLSKPVQNTVIRNQYPETGERYLVETDGIVLEYHHRERYDKAERLDRKLEAEIGWIESFTSHGPSVGTHYEESLLDIIRDYLPGGICVCTGFVFDSLSETCSPQMDILCFKDTESAPLYRRRNNFAIVQPHTVIAACEVKKTLKKSDLVEWIGKTIGLNMGSHHSTPIGIQQMSVFAFSSKTTTATLISGIKDALSKFSANFISKTKGGSAVAFPTMHMTLPQIYLRDRPEFISVRLMRLDTDDIDGELVIDVLRGGGPNGVGPFLGSLIPIRSSTIRDHCSSFLNNVIESHKTGLKIIPMVKIGSEQLKNL